MVVLNRTSCEKSLWAVWTLEKVIFDVVSINKDKIARNVMQKVPKRCQEWHQNYSFIDSLNDNRNLALSVEVFAIQNGFDILLIHPLRPHHHHHLFIFLLSSVRFAIWFGTLWLICVISRRIEFSRNCSWSSSSRGSFCSLMLNVNDDDDISGGKNNID